ncbi:membrane protein [Sesbania bispinosa]|nr:membrane protein [Sesbania bispinosa]
MRFVVHQGILERQLLLLIRIVIWGLRIHLCIRPRCHGRRYKRILNKTTLHPDGIDNKGSANTNDADHGEWLVGKGSSSAGGLVNQPKDSAFLPGKDSSKGKSNFRLEDPPNPDPLLMNATVSRIHHNRRKKFTHIPAQGIKTAMDVEVISENRLRFKDDEVPEATSSDNPFKVQKDEALEK